GTAVLSYTSNDRNATSKNRLWDITAVDAIGPDIDAIDNINGDIDFALAYDPYSGRLHFGTDDINALRFTVRLYDSTGRLQRTFRACDGTTLANLPRGLYIITWELNGRRRTVKLNR
ncbi:MAG: T9SS type A sorting domain-containing protein, partial [Bacteroidaceae bacterium]|nr:T9SS type A sorting domain-containing protein [Bacteroidaceae bacterium]